MSFKMNKTQSGLSHSPVPTDTDDFGRATEDMLPFPKFDPKDPNLVHLSPTQKDHVRRDNIMNWVKQISK
jgi:hypothetical protein